LIHNRTPQKLEGRPYQSRKTARLEMGPGMTLRNKRPTPSDFDPFIADGRLEKVCTDCFEILPIEYFEREDGSYSKMCSGCRAERGDDPPVTRDPFVGERIAEGFRLLGLSEVDDDE
jgi:hypothetical protein